MIGCEVISMQGDVIGCTYAVYVHREKLEAVFIEKETSLFVIRTRESQSVRRYQSSQSLRGRVPGLKKNSAWYSRESWKFFNVSAIGMGTIPIPSIDTVDTCKLVVSIDTSTKYR